MRRTWLVGLVVLAVTGVGTAAGAAGSETRPPRVTVVVAGERMTLGAGRPTAARALTKAGVTPTDGALLAAASRAVLDPLHDHGYVLVNGRPASMDTRLRRGWRVDLHDGADVVEETARREVALPYPNQDKVGMPGWIAGAEGLGEEVYGVVSGEVAERRVIREPVAAVELQRPAAVSAGSAVFLTFDDGPDPTWTPRVLDLLRAKGVTATFCVVGRYVAARPDLARRIVSEGHALCNHSQTHARLDSLATAAVEAEIVGAASTIAAATGVRPSVFRVPYGRSSAVVDDVIARQGLRKLGWTVDPSDYSRPGATAIVSRVAQAVRPGAIVLLHDGGGDRSQTLDALDQMIDGLRDAGYTFGRP